MPDVLLSLLAALSTVIASFVAAILSQRSKKATKARRDRLTDAVTADIKTKIHRPAFTTYAPSIDWKVVARSLVSAASTEPGRSEVETQKAVEEATASVGTSIEDRIRQIEERFPDADTIEKVTSINEAVLAVTLKNVQKALERVESRLLTKWDVAKIVFQILTALGVIVAIIFGVITYIRSP